MQKPHFMTARSIEQELIYFKAGIRTIERSDPSWFFNTFENNHYPADEHIAQSYYSSH